MRTKNRILNKITIFLKENEKISFALLFGSAVKKDLNYMSDLDIGLFLNYNLSLLELGQIISGIEKISNKKVDVIELNNLYNKNPLLSYNIVSQCELLFAKNESEYIDFKRKTYLYYLDTQKLRKSVRYNFKKRITEKKFGNRNYA